MMEQLYELLQNPVWFIPLIGIIGLLIGSFLNVVIHRLPIMMRQDWRKECLEYLQLTPDPPQPVFNLSVPRSRCPHCDTLITAQQNIPVLSYLLLKGRCASCQQAISLRYPVIEAFTALTSMIVAAHFGPTVQTAFALLLTWGLLALSVIDMDHQLLPDSITMPLLWLGLLLTVFEIFTDSHAGIIGAVAGYLSLWSVYQGFKLLTGKEGMGYGDFKLLALFGAWLGWQYLPVIILLSSLVGAIIGSSLILFQGRDRAMPIPFGPYLAAAGWLALLWGKQLNQFYFNIVGL